MMSVPAFVVAGAKPNPDAQIAKAITPNVFHMIIVSVWLLEIKPNKTREVAGAQEQFGISAA